MNVSEIEAALLFAISESGDRIEITMMSGAGSGSIELPRAIAILLGQHLAGLNETQS